MRISKQAGPEGVTSDRVSLEILFELLHIMGLPTHFINLMKACYRNASVVVSIDGNISHQVPVHRGVRQGCPASPTLFNLYVCMVPRLLAALCPNAGVPLGQNGRLRCLMYADDVLLVSKSAKHLQQLLNGLEVACSYLEHTISAQKSEIVVFNGTKHDRQRSFTVQGGTIRVVRKARYLGILFDDKCSNNTMAQSRLATAEDMAARAHAFAHDQHIMDVQCLNTLFKTTVMQSMLYGVQVWGMDMLLKHDAYDNPLQHVFTRFMKTRLHLPKSTSHVIVGLESGQRPVHYYALKRAALFFQKLAETRSLIVAHVLEHDDTDIGLMSTWRKVLNKYTTPTKACVLHQIC